MASAPSWIWRNRSRSVILTLVRTAVLVIVSAALLATVLLATEPSPPTIGASISTLVVPDVVLVGERVSVYAGANLPDAAVRDRRLRACELPTGECRITGGGTLTGPGEWNGFVGSFTPERPGSYLLSWTLYSPWRADTGRAEARAETEVTVVAPAP